MKYKNFHSAFSYQIITIVMENFWLRIEICEI